MTKLSKPLYFWVVLLSCIYLFIEGGSWVCLRVLEWKGIREIPHFQLNDQQKKGLQEWAHDTQSFFMFSPTLGWTNRPGAVRFPGREAINSQGIRSDRTFSSKPGTGVLRIATFGDSFTYGANVALADTWQEYLMKKHGNWEILNFGVAAYGPDQALWRYRETGSAFHPHIVLIGFMAENINRTVNVFRPFYTRSSDVMPTKPRFVLRDGNISLVPNPVQTPADLKKLLENEDAIEQHLAQHDYFYQTEFLPQTPLDFLPSVRLAKITINQVQKRVMREPIMIRGVFNSRSEAFIITREVLTMFYREALAEGRLPIVILFPDRTTHEQYQRGSPITYGPLRDYFQSNHMRYIDILPKFAAEGGSSLFDHSNHYSPRGNNLVSEAIEQYLEMEGLQDLIHLQRVLKNEQSNFVTQSRLQ